MKPLLVIAEDLWWPLPTALSETYDVIYQPDLHKDRAALLQRLEQAAGLIVRNRTAVDEELLKSALSLQVVGRLGVGLDNIDLRACRQRSVTVVAARGCNANSVAEFVLAAMLQHARPLREYHRRTGGGEWNRAACMGTEIGGKTLGLVGVGDIGQRVAVRARAFGMNVIACDPFLLPASMLVQDFGVALTDLRTVLQSADYVSIHVPLTPETRNLLADEEMRVMKERAVLINTARGGIIDESALASSLHEHPNRLAVLDVRTVEPPPRDDPLRELPNVWLTPHIAGITDESSERVATFILEEVCLALQGSAVRGVIV